jgi:hypothetical protein
MYKDYKFKVFTRYNSVGQMVYCIQVNNGDVHSFNSKGQLSDYLQYAKKILDNKVGGIWIDKLQENKLV